MTQESKWRHMSFQSGTQIVTTNLEGQPHYYVYADERSKVCDEFVAWLNDGERPVWADSLVISETETECLGQEGIRILAVGPMILPPGDNGRLQWQQDSTKEDERKALIADIAGAHGGWAMGVVPQKPPKKKLPVIKGEYGYCNHTTGSRIYGAWECEWCHRFNLTRYRKCENCGAPRIEEKRPMFIETSSVDGPADLRGRNVFAAYLDDAWDDVEPDPDLHDEIEK